VRIRPGRNLVRLAAVLLILAPITFVWPGAPVLPVAAVTLLVAVSVATLEYLALRTALRGVSIERTMPAAIGRDAPFRVDLRVSSTARFSFAAELRDVVPAAAVPPYGTQALVVPAGGRASCAATLQLPVRGAFDFGPVWVRLTGPFDVLQAQQALVCPGRVKVLPEGFSSGEGLRHDERAQLLLLDKIARVRQTGHGTEFEMLSEYRPGDDPRRIDWKTSVRVQRRVVRRFQVERHRDVMIVIDCGRLMGAEADRGSKLDCAVDSALMLCRTALESGDRVGLALFAEKVVGYQPPVSGPRALRLLVDSVYNVQSRWAESDFGLMFATLQSRQTKRSLVVILSDIVDVETSTRFRTSLASLSRRHVVLFAGLQTPLLRQIVAEPVASLLDGSRKAVTFRILRERDEALRSLKRSGVQVLDVEPSRLTVPLLNRFIELRHQNVL
jgi:uncharacterized protein (DUF58 family)